MQDWTKGREGKIDGDAGYVLIAVIFMCVILLIALAIAAPNIARSIQRDKELETIHRGEQYKRAIKLYYQKFGRYPTSIDQLVETNQIRFLRKRYTDPLTGKDDWKPVYFGQAHVRPLGFFGQPLMMAGALNPMAGSMYAPVATATTTTDANGFPVASSDASTAAGAGGTSSMFGQPSSGMGPGASGSLGATNGVSGMFAQSSSTMGMGSAASSPTGTTGTGLGTGIGGGTSGTTFGGGPIVGFTLPVDKPSLVDYKLQTRYNKWEFNYDPTEEQAQAMSGLAGGAPTGTNPAGLTQGNNPGQVTPGQIPTNPNPNPTGDSGSGSTPDSGSPQ